MAVIRVHDHLPEGAVVVRVADGVQVAGSGTVWIPAPDEAVEPVCRLRSQNVVVPLDQQPFYPEKIVHLPDSYQVNDSKRQIASRIPTRRELGIPEQAFVFCCFNNSWKINAAMFDIWMRLLAAVDGSVLWLFWSNDMATANLRVEAKARGIDPARLVFAERSEPEAHLARHRLADLFPEEAVGSSVGEEPGEVAHPEAAWQQAAAG